MATRVQLIGNPTLFTAGGSGVRVERKASALLLLASRAQATDRSRAAEWLWPAAEAAQARTNLRVALHRLNLTAGKRIFTDSGELCLADCIVDISHYLHASLTCETVLKLLSEPLLGTFDFDDCSAFSGLRNEIAETILNHAEREALRLSALALDVNAVPQKAIAFLEQTLQLRPLSEALSRLLIETHIRLGNRPSALAAYERLRATMINELGIGPSPETQQLQIRILHAARSDSKDTADLRVTNTEWSELPLVERETTLQRLWISAASGHHLWLEGEAGVGKSRLIKEFTSALKRTCVINLRNGNDQLSSYSALRRLVFQLREVVGLGTLPSTLRYFAQLSDTGREGIKQIGDAATIADSLLKTLINTHDLGIDAIVIDDMQFADPSSSTVFSILFDLIKLLDDTKKSVPTFVVAARVGTAALPFLQLSEACKNDPRWEYVDVEPLSSDGIMAIVHSIGVTFERVGMSVEHLHRHTGGNPFFISELMREVRWGHPVTQKLVPKPIASLFRSRIASLSADAFTLLEIANCSGTDFEPGMPEEVGSWSAQSLLSAWNELRQVGIFGSSGFSHDLARSAVELYLEGPVRHALHSGIADYLRGIALPERVAHHLIQARRHADALPFAVDAARRLIRENALDDTVHLLRSVLNGSFEDLDAVGRSARFKCACLAAYSLSLFNNEICTNEQFGFVDQLRNLASTPEEKVIARCWTAQANLEKNLLEDALAVCQPSLSDDSPWGWLLRVFHATALTRLGDLQAALEILPRPAKASDSETSGYGLRAYSYYLQTLLGLGQLDRAEEAQTTFQIQGHLDYWKNLWRGAIAEERGNIHSACYWQYAFFDGIAKSRYGVSAGNLALSHIRLAILEMRRGRLTVARNILTEMSGYIDLPQVKNDYKLVEAQFAHLIGDAVGYRRAMQNASLEGDPENYLYVQWIEVNKALEADDSEGAHRIYLDGLQKALGCPSIGAVQSANSLAFRAYQLLGCRFADPQRARLMALETLINPFEQQRKGLIALASLEHALACIRLGDQKGAARGLRALQNADFLAFTPIILPPEFVKTTTHLLDQCDRLEFAALRSRLSVIDGYLGRQRMLLADSTTEPFSSELFA